MNGEFCSPSIVHQFDAPESILWVAPPSEDGLSVEGDFAPMLMEEDFAAGVAEDGNREELLTRPGSQWARRALSGSFVSRRLTAWVDVILVPLGWRTAICTLLFGVLLAGAVVVSSVTEAAVSMNAVEDKSGGLAQPEWYLIEFANIMSLTTSVLINSAGVPCQVGGVGRPAVGQPVLKVLPPIVLVRVAPNWWPALRDVHMELV